MGCHAAHERGMSMCMHSSWDQRLHDARVQNDSPKTWSYNILFVRQARFLHNNGGPSNVLGLPLIVHVQFPIAYVK